MKASPYPLWLFIIISHIAKSLEVIRGAVMGQGIAVESRGGLQLSYLGWVVRVGKKRWQKNRSNTLVRGGGDLSWFIQKPTVWIKRQRRNFAWHLNNKRTPEARRGYPQNAISYFELECEISISELDCCISKFWEKYGAIMCEILNHY